MREETFGNFIHCYIPSTKNYAALLQKRSRHSLNVCGLIQTWRKAVMSWGQLPSFSSSKEIQCLYVFLEIPLHPGLHISQVCWFFLESEELELCQLLVSREEKSFVFTPRYSAPSAQSNETQPEFFPGLCKALVILWLLSAGSWNRFPF